MPSINGPAAYTLIGAFVALVLYGFYLLLFGATIHLICFQPRLRAARAILLPTSILMFCMITVSRVLECLVVFDGVILYTTEMDPDIYILQSLSMPSYITMETLLSATILVADAILVYRAWTVWRPRWTVVVFSVALWFVNLALIIPIIVFQVNPNLGNLLRYDYVYLASTLAQNIVTTCLIAYRLWTVDCAASAYREGSLMPIVWILAESGGLYVATILGQILTIVLGGELIFCTEQIQGPLIGIINSLIMVRIGLRGRAEAYHPTHPASHNNHAANSRDSELIEVTIVRELESAGDISSVFEGTLGQKDAPNGL